MHHSITSNLSSFPAGIGTPKPIKPFADEATSIGLVLIQDFEGKGRVVFYITRRLLDTKTRYTELEHLCLCLHFICNRLWHYFINTKARVICKINIIKHMLLVPILKG